MDKKRFIINLFLTLCLIIAPISFSGCKKDFSYVQKTTSGTITVGQSVSVYDYLELTSAPNKIRWESSNPQIASVDKNGVITGIEQGTTKITTEIYDNEIFFDITVIKEVSGISLPSTLSLETDEVHTLVPTILPSTATDQSVFWASSNTDVATIENGIIHTKKEGRTTITATTTDGNFSASCVLSVGWNGKTQTPVKETSGVYHITSASELNWIKNQINAREIINPTIVLDCSINLFNKEWEPISSSDSSIFRGLFDGNGHTISNLKITNTRNYNGLFGINEGTISNLKTTGSIIVSSSSTSQIYCGGIVGYSNKGEILNCSSSCTITATQTQNGSCHAGGIAGFIYNTTIKNCNFSGAITGTTSSSSATLQVCGIGASNYNSLIYNSTNAGTLKASTPSTSASAQVLAGITLVNTTNKTANLLNCSSTGKLILLKNGYSFNVCNKNQIDQADVYNQTVFNSLLATNNLSNITITGSIDISQSLNFNKSSSITIANGGTLNILSGVSFTTKGTLISNGTINISGSSLTAFDTNSTATPLAHTRYNSESTYIKVAFNQNASLNVKGALNYTQNGTINLLSHTTNAAQSSSFETAINYVVSNNIIPTASGAVIK